MEYFIKRDSYYLDLDRPTSVIGDIGLGINPIQPGELLEIGLDSSTSLCADIYDLPHSTSDLIRELMNVMTATPTNLAQRGSKKA